MKKKKIFLTILIVAITIVTALSVSYAYWAATKVQDSSNIVASDCLNINFNELSDAINLNRTYPGERQSLLNSYAFTITNTCTTKVSYDVNLDTLEGTDLDLKYLNTILTGYNSFEGVINNFDEFETFEGEVQMIANEYNKLLNTYDSVTPTLDNAIFSNKLATSLINPGEHHNYAISILLDNNTTDEEAMNKTWMGKVVINSTTPTPISVNLNANGGEVDTSSMFVYANDRYGSLPKPTRAGYTFKYWYLGNDENNTITDHTLVSTNETHTLNAKWIDNSQMAILDENAFFNYWLDNQRVVIKNILPFKGNLTSNDLTTLRAIEVQDENSEYPVYFFLDQIPYEMKIYNLYYYSPACIYMKEDYFGYRYVDNTNYYAYKYINTIDLSLINTSLMTNMSQMFNESNASIIDVSSFDTSNVTNMDYMFAGCNNLTTLDLSNFDTSNVTDMSGMFAYDSNLTNINLASFNTSNVTTMYKMFTGCSNITTLDLSNFTDTNLTSVNSMFMNCTSLKNINLQRFSDKEMDDSMMLCNVELDELLGYVPSEEAYICPGPPN